MPFIKGQSGNLKGRPKGSINKTTYDLRVTIAEFLENNFEKISTDFELLQPKDRIKYYCELLNFGLPKLQTTILESDYDSLPDSQLDQIIERIINNRQN